MDGSFSGSSRHAVSPSPSSIFDPCSSTSQSSVPGPQHSTPIKQTKRRAQVTHSTPSILDGTPSSSRTNSPSAYNSIHTHSPTHGSSMARVHSPSRSHQNGLSSSRFSSSLSRQAQITEFENNTIQKQRKELQLLIAELRDRDKELNEMVASHQKQLLAWEEDRQRILTLEQRNARMEDDVQQKHEQIKLLTARLKVAESQDQSKANALDNTQQQLKMVTEQHSQATLQLKQVQEKNTSLNDSVHEMSSHMGQLEAREEELLTLLRLKDKDLSEASSHICDLSAKVKRLDQQCQECRRLETEARRQATDWKHKYSEGRKQVEKLKNEMAKSNHQANEEHIELSKCRQQVADLRKQLVLSTEREKRKDELLDLQRSKQERTDKELTNLRQLYERQQRDLAILHLNLESSKEMLAQQHSLVNSKHSPSHAFSPGNQSNDSSSFGTAHLFTNQCNSLSASGDKKLSKSTGDLRDLPEEGVSDQFGSQSLPVPPAHSGHTHRPAAKNGPESELESSPTSKLQRLLTESRQMVESLERSTVPPYVQERSRSPGPQEAQEDDA